MVADDPDCRIELKSFHAAIQNDHEALKNEQASYQRLPIVRNVDAGMVLRNYLQIKQDVEDLVEAVMEQLLSNPQTAGTIVRKN